MTTCEKAAIICNKVQYKEATLVEKIKLKLHLLTCKTCSMFTKKNTEFSTLCKKANLSSLSEEEKNLMKKMFNDNI